MSTIGQSPQQNIRRTRARQASQMTPGGAAGAAEGVRSNKRRKGMTGTTIFHGAELENHGVEVENESFVDHERHETAFGAKTETSGTAHAPREAANAPREAPEAPNEAAEAPSAAPSANPTPNEAPRAPNEAPTANAPANAPLRTPGPTSRRSSQQGNNYIDTPTRKARLEEKKELGELNQRLRLYIMRVREREAAEGGLQRELEFVKTRATEENAQIRTHYEQQIETLKKQKMEEQNKSTQMQKEIAQINSEITNLNREVKEAKEEKMKAEKKMQNAQAEMKSLQTKIAAAETELAQAGEYVDNVNAKMVKLAKEHENAEAQLESATTRANSAEAKLQMLQEDYQQQLTVLTNELDALRAKNTELSEQQLELEDELRREFGMQLKNILEERQKQYELEKDELREDLLDAYQQQIDERDQELNKLTDNLQEATTNLRDLQARVSQERTEAADAIARRAELEKRVETLSQQVEVLNERAAKESAERSKLIQTYQTQLNRKDVDFQTLMDVKIALDNEIRQYRQLLDTEDDRLNSASNTRAPSLRVSPSGQLAAVGQTIQLAEVDLAHRRVTVVNVGMHMVSLAGYSISVPETGVEYKFPAHVKLPADALLHVSTIEATEDTLRWTIDEQAELWTPGFQLQLHDDLDTVISTITIPM